MAISVPISYAGNRRVSELQWVADPVSGATLIMDASGNLTPATTVDLNLSLAHGKVLVGGADGIAKEATGLSVGDDGSVSMAGVPVYANNAAAIAAGLVAGDMYRTGGDPDPLCIVH